MELNIKSLRKSKGITQAELAEQAGISRQTLISLERNSVKNTTAGTLHKIASALGCKVDDLILPETSSELD